MESKNEFLKLYCFGCGLPLQNEDAHKPGYVPKYLERDSHFLCQRCFRLQHYGENAEGIVCTADYKTIIQNAKKEGALIVYVVDLFAFESSLIDFILKQIKEMNIIIIASKRDIIPQSIKDEKLIKFIRDKLALFDINPIDVIVSSAIKNYNIEEIMHKLNSYRKNKSIYVFGASSVGKSSLINSFLKLYNNDTFKFITTSPYPGTTLDVINVPLDDTTYIYDTPGVLLNTSIFAHVDNKLIKYILPRKEIKPRVYQIQNNQSLLVENIAKIDIICKDKMNLTVFLSNDLKIVRSKYENSNRVFANMIKNKQIHLCDRNIQSVDDLCRHDLQLPENDCDVVISGLLWIKLKGKGESITVYAPKGVLINIRDCKI